MRRIAIAAVLNALALGFLVWEVRNSVGTRVNSISEEVATSKDMKIGNPEQAFGDGRSLGRDIFTPASRLTPIKRDVDALKDFTLKGILGPSDGLMAVVQIGKQMPVTLGRGDDINNLKIVSVRHHSVVLENKGGLSIVLLDPPNAE